MEKYINVRSWPLTWVLKVSLSKRGGFLEDDICLLLANPPPKIVLTFFFVSKLNISIIIQKSYRVEIYMRSLDNDPQRDRDLTG